MYDWKNWPKNLIHRYRIYSILKEVYFSFVAHFLNVCNHMHGYPLVWPQMMEEETNFHELQPYSQNSPKEVKMQHKIIEQVPKHF